MACLLLLLLVVCIVRHSMRKSAEPVDSGACLRCGAMSSLTTHTPGKEMTSGGATSMEMATATTKATPSASGAAVATAKVHDDRCVERVPRGVGRRRPGAFVLQRHRQRRRSDKGGQGARRTSTSRTRAHAVAQKAAKKKAKAEKAKAAAAKAAKAAKAAGGGDNDKNDDDDDDDSSNLENNYVSPPTVSHNDYYSVRWSVCARSDVTSGRDAADAAAERDGAGRVRRTEQVECVQWRRGRATLR